MVHWLKVIIRLLLHCGGAAGGTKHAGATRRAHVVTHVPDEQLGPRLSASAHGARTNGSAAQRVANPPAHLMLHTCWQRTHWKNAVCPSSAPRTCADQ